ncbi:MAG: hypothetical protein KDI78_15520 [Xanthomonadales bacterium]|nr:hypothetical protein [Xanthomonadales bacterium]
MIAARVLATQLRQLPMIRRKTRIACNAPLNIPLGRIRLAKSHTAGADKEMQRCAIQPLGLGPTEQIQRFGRVSMIAEQLADFSQWLDVIALLKSRITGQGQSQFVLTNSYQSLEQHGQCMWIRRLSDTGDRIYDLVHGTPEIALRSSNQ